METEIPSNVKWRGSSYDLIEVDEDTNRVKWRNPVSRHEAYCSVEAWKASDLRQGTHE